ncbi:xyloglucan glycosyltransferase 4 [Pyrus ussuriensis x Pyrus communis]|uniref:Xyloglucan glycosyltransferase 4 n=1 Tax=Pyrus ussuriensis x Pyrus communis TaxID=2448454 RepID=A0A5N5GET1_9ROSA|nr:xyloglucan glycosyltransferase 4 [Pyrus ussuriensis x Pyrus communis]
MALRAMFLSLKKRIALSELTNEEPKTRGRLYRCIKAFLGVVDYGSGRWSDCALSELEFEFAKPWEVQWSMVCTRRSCTFPYPWKGLMDSSEWLYYTIRNLTNLTNKEWEKKRGKHSIF